MYVSQSLKKSERKEISDSQNVRFPCFPFLSCTSRGIIIEGKREFERPDVPKTEAASRALVKREIIKRTKSGNKMCRQPW